MANHETTNRIQVLPEVVQNKIAAGEVVERPASVVKELTENAIDAGARSICIELEEGGRRLVRVSDDGSGMGEEDLVRCIERHATSKISDVDDIFHIRTMGFRGEALPSIGSVSRMRISTCLTDAPSGHELLVEAGATRRVCPCAPRPGTVVEVRDLFYNTPARLKFLKSPAAEVAAVSEWVTRLALAHPHIAFRIDNGGRRTLDLPAHNALAERIAQLFGRDIAARLIAVNAQIAEGLHIEGFVAHPSESRANSRNIYTFLNQRWIRHRGLQRVIADAYQGALPPRRFPFAVLYLHLDPQQVDVNVHPTKEEVRFENDKLVIGSTRRAVQGALQEAAHAEVRGGGEIHLPETAAPISEAAAEAAPRYEPPTTLSSSPASFVRNEPAAAPDAHLERPAPVVNTAPPLRAVSDTTPAPQAEQPALPLPEGTRHRVLAQAGDRYLVVEYDGGIKLVDQHALHERWNYEQLQQKEHPVESQRLLLPVVVDLSPQEASLFSEVLPVLHEFGFEAERFGETSLSISAVPTIVKLKHVDRVVHDLFADVTDGRQPSLSIREQMLASLACRSAVLFGQHLPREQMVALLDRFEKAKQPLTCPHGRPTTVTLRWDELERRFGRA